MLALICNNGGSRKLCNFETHFKVPFSSFLPLSPFSILSLSLTHSASFCGGAFPLEANFRFPKFGETQIRRGNCNSRRNFSSRAFSSQMFPYQIIIAVQMAKYLNSGLCRAQTDYVTCSANYPFSKF